MVNKTFAASFVAACCAASLTLAVQAAFYFGERLINKKRNAINATALSAAVLTVTYTCFKVSAIFADKGEISCDSVVYVGGLFSSVSNALCFLHLFLRADAVNKLNRKWPPWRIFGIIITIANWVVVVAILFTRASLANKQEGNASKTCNEQFNTAVYGTKWAIELLNCIVFSGLFVWPLVTHLQMLQKSAAASASMKASFRSATSAVGGGGGSLNIATYRRLVWRAVLAMGTITLFTALSSILVFVHLGSDDFVTLVQGFTVLNNGIIVAGIRTANSGANMTEWLLQEAKRRPSLAMAVSDDVSGCKGTYTDAAAGQSFVRGAADSTAVPGLADARATMA